MAGVEYQGGIISIIKSGFDDILNDDPEDALYFQFSYTSNILIDIDDPEWFASKGTTAAAVTFKEVKTQTNAEDFHVHIYYKITTTS